MRPQLFVGPWCSDVALVTVFSIATQSLFLVLILRKKKKKTLAVFVMPPVDTSAISEGQGPWSRDDGGPVNCVIAVLI
jgi:hypothetical protein